MVSGLLIIIPIPFCKASEALAKRNLRTETVIGFERPAVGIGDGDILLPFSFPARPA